MPIFLNALIFILGYVHGDPFTSEYRSLSFSSQKIILRCIYIMCVYVHHMCAWYPKRSEKTSDLKEMELWMLVSHVGTLN